MNEYDSWNAAWGDTIAKEPTRHCQCGGTFSNHRIICPYAPPYGYDPNGEPYKESQVVKVSRELGRKAAVRVNEAVMTAILKDLQAFKAKPWNMETTFTIGGE